MSSQEERLESPEERLGKNIGLREKVLLLWGPGVVALGAAVAGGEFILAPELALSVGLGLLWITLLSVLLQSVYLYSWVRLVTAYGETPIALMFRVNVIIGILGTSLLLFNYIWASWIYGSASSLSSLVLGKGFPELHSPLTTTLATIVLLVLTLAILSVGHRIGRTLEVLSWVSSSLLVLSFLLLALLLVPLGVWGELAKGVLSFGYLPEGAELPTLWAFWNYAGYASGLGYVLASYFKDKGYGMGARTGYIPALLGSEGSHVPPTGRLFSPTPENLSAYRRWLSLAKEEVFLIFFLGALLSMWLPIAIAYAAATGGLGAAVRLGSPAWLGLVLQNAGWGYAGFMLGAFLGFLLFFKSQVIVMDLIARTLADAVWRTERLRRLAGGDLSLVYYSLLGGYLLWASLSILFEVPLLLLYAAASAPEAAALIGVPTLLYLNYRVVPKELRLHPALVALNVIFMILCLGFLLVRITWILGLL
ncbi:MAG: Nramp family divalent metal transporter [Acidilobaceae archaeon]